MATDILANGSCRGKTLPDLRDYQSNKLARAWEKIGYAAIGPVAFKWFEFERRA